MKFILIFILFFCGCTETKTKIVYRDREVIKYVDGLPLGHGLLWYTGDSGYYIQLDSVDVSATGFRSYTGIVRPMTSAEIEQLIFKDWLNPWNYENWNFHIKNK
jgi:hypothetical protein